MRTNYLTLDEVVNYIGLGLCSMFRYSTNNWCIVAYPDLLLSRSDTYTKVPLDIFLRRNSVCGKRPVWEVKLL